jgi:hypothetical protein
MVDVVADTLDVGCCVVDGVVGGAGVARRKLSVFRRLPGAVKEQSLMLPTKQDGPVMSCAMLALNAFLYPTPSFPFSGYTGGLVME